MYFEHLLSSLAKSAKEKRKIDDDLFLLVGAAFARAMEQSTRGWQTVPPCTPHLLIVRLQVSRSPIVHHASHVWLINPHAVCE